MRLFSLLLTGLLINFSSFGQSNPSIYIGAGTGLYSYNGLIGLAFEVPLTPKVSCFGAFGNGGWGMKAGGGVKLYMKNEQFGSSFSFGYSNAFGLSGFETDLELTDGSKQKVTLNLRNAATINFMYDYNFHLGKRSKFVLGTGYALATSTKAYEVVSPEKAELNSFSKQVLQIMQPGGLILSCTFLIAIG